MTERISNQNIIDIAPLPTPKHMQEMLPLPLETCQMVLQARQAIRDILHGQDTHRLAVIIGPCSIHDPEAAIKYAEQLKKVADRVRDHHGPDDVDRRAASGQDHVAADDDESLPLELSRDRQIAVDDEDTGSRAAPGDREITFDVRDARIALRIEVPDHHVRVGAGRDLDVHVLDERVRERVDRHRIDLADRRIRADT